MSRRRSKPRLVKTLPIAMAVLGAGLRAARKRRAAGRRAAERLRDQPAADNQALPPSWSPPVVEPPATGGSGQSHEVPVDVASSGDTVEIGSAATNGSTTQTQAATPAEAPSAPPSDAAPGRARGATTNDVLEALSKGGAMTAAEVALATGLGRATTSSTLSRLARSGQITKAERGYRLSEADPSSPSSSKGRAPQTTTGKARSTDAPPKPSSTRTRSRAAGVTDAATAPAGRGATKAKVLAALSTDQGLTAGEVATATGLSRGTISTTLSKLAKNGEVVKADRGYRLPG